MKSSTFQRLLTLLPTELVQSEMSPQQIAPSLDHLQEQVSAILQYRGKELPRAGRKQYVLTCLASLTLDCACLYAAYGSLEQLQMLFEYWEDRLALQPLHTGAPWEYAVMQLLEASARLYRLTCAQFGGTEYLWKQEIRSTLTHLLSAIDYSAVLLGSTLEQRIERAYQGLPLLPANMHCLGTGLLSWILPQDADPQTRLIVLERGDGHLATLDLPQGGTGQEGQVFALVCEECDAQTKRGDGPGVPYHQPLLLGQGHLRGQLEISPLSHACWLSTNDGTTDPWDQTALHRVDYRYAHLLFVAAPNTGAWRDPKRA